ncbi:DNA-directed RNA polymerase sigma-70 factor [Planotetraspora thailandica]|uniref:DNA-directed RNA polymerase sigma-70 factor n=1 Tax=Planotetraspora thailandica TaxID=487172 RepID=A0A8J4DCU6_9ACTN|nr:sigma-70 family RNA polymerase sigma factor [Planotetraspora thailandica]GII58168.1 DNA-directed RNA polymerase sigma-70 factor [Planotetraspora thailandica]
MDDRLESRLASGDATAVGECYHAHAAAVRAYLRRLVPYEDVDDVLQVVFTEVWRSRHRFDPARSLPAWLLGIARKRAVDHLRTRRPPTLSLDAVGDPAGRDGRVDVDELADRDRVRRALDELPVVQRQAIELAYYGDLTQREVADRLRVPLGTVKARTARGLHRLAALLPRAVA